MFPDREPGDNNAHEDAFIAVRDAFDAMEPKIKAWADTRAGRPAALQGRIAEFRPDRDVGQIALTFGQLVHFQRHSVLGGGFDNLARCDTVGLAVAEGESLHGPHASIVRRISPARFVDTPR